MSAMPLAIFPMVAAVAGATTIASAQQGHIATKTLDFEKTIAITNGMPILRTSVDHGTAFDIAGKGIVSAVSMVEAILLAAKYAPNFTKEK